MKGRIPQSVLDEINYKTDIVDLVGHYVDLKQTGTTWKGLCPFHSEKTPSFSVNPEGNFFHCFGCGKSGGVYQFLMEMESLSFPEAVQALAEKAGVALPEFGQESESAGKHRKTLEDLYFRVSRTFRWLLLNHKDAEKARRYLSERGIDDETAEKYGLGWSPGDGEWLYHFLLKKQFSPEFLASSGLFSKKSPRWCYFTDRLIFPVMRDAHQVLAFSGRALGDRGPKYINSPETRIYKKNRELYGFGQARQTMRKTRTAILCEGNVDVLACAQAGFAHTVAPLGTAFTREQARLIKRQADTLIILFDGDEAGRKATFRAAVIAEEAGFTVKTAVLPPKSDPADILLQNGPDFLKKIINSAILFFDYFVDLRANAQHDLSGEKQEEVLKELTPYLEAVGTDVRREAYLKQLAEAMKASPAAFIRDFTNRRRIRKPVSRNVQSEDQSFEAAGDELFLMTAVAVKPEFFPLLRELLAPEILKDRRALSVYRVLDDMFVHNRAPNVQLLADSLSDEPLRNYILEKAASQEYNNNPEETIRGIVNRIVLRTLSDERNELLRSMARDSGDDTGKQKARIERIRVIDREMMKNQAR